MSRLTTLARGRDASPNSPSGPLPKTFLRATRAAEDRLLKQAFERDFGDVWDELDPSLDPPNDDVGELSTPDLG